MPGSCRGFAFLEGGRNLMGGRGAFKQCLVGLQIGTADLAFIVTVADFGNRVIWVAV